MVVPDNQLREVMILREKHGMLRVVWEVGVAEASADTQYAVSIQERGHKL